MDPAMRSAFGLKGKADDKTIQKQLILKKISYGSLNGALVPDQDKDKAIPHNSKCRYGERGAAAARPKAQIILDAAKVSAASGGNSEPKQGQRSQSARGFCPRSTIRVPQPDIIEHFGNADAVPQPPERCLSRKAGIMRCCHKFETCFVFNSEQMDSFASGKQRSRSNIIQMLERWML